MTPEHKEQFDNEQLLGNRAQNAYDTFIKEFIEVKRKTLFDSFNVLPLTADTDIMEIKRMSYAIDTLEAEILTVIETGKLASISIEKEESKK